MNVTINRECTSLKEYAQQLCKEIVDKVQFTKAEHISTTLPQITTSHVSNPDRPWKIAGGVAIAAGVLTIISSNSFWGYLLGAGGIVSFYIGTTKTSSKVKNQSKAKGNNSFSGLELSERVLETTKEIEGKWRNKVESAKSAVQRAITASTIDESIKQSLMGETYYTERINFDVSYFVDRLAATSDMEFAKRIVQEYGDKMCAKIRSVCDAQIGIYNKISKQL